MCYSRNPSRVHARRLHLRHLVSVGTVSPTVLPGMSRRDHGVNCTRIPDPACRRRGRHEFVRVHETAARGWVCPGARGASHHLRRHRLASMTAGRLLEQRESRKRSVLFDLSDARRAHRIHPEIRGGVDTLHLWPRGRVRDGHMAAPKSPIIAIARAGRGPDSAIATPGFACFILQRRGRRTRESRLLDAAMGVRWPCRRIRARTRVGMGAHRRVDEVVFVQVHTSNRR